MDVLKRPKMELMRNPIFIGFGIVEAVLIGVGSWCLLFVDVDHTMTVEHEYMRVNICRDSEIDLPCTEFIPDPPLTKCDCKIDFQLKQDLKGTVILYYELEFDQTNVTYASSKDDNQLLGNPGHVPAESCGKFRYDKYNKTIFPCGEIADSLFNDTFVLQRLNESSREDEPVPVEYTNLLSGDVLKFKNPPLEVLKNFSEPISWNRKAFGKLPWEAHTNRTGVENPAFRAWMDTRLKRKPVYRVQQRGQYSNGLPTGNYSFFIIMHYGVNRYNGTRTLILEAVHTEKVRRSPGWGIALLLVATVLLLGVLARAACRKRETPDGVSREWYRLRSGNIRDKLKLNSYRNRIQEI